MVIFDDLKAFSGDVPCLLPGFLPGSLLCRKAATVQGTDLSLG